ncbi:MAG: hypothetical protein U0470_14340 [Anaerolineae bacterium]
MLASCAALAAVLVRAAAPAAPATAAPGRQESTLIVNPAADAASDHPYARTSSGTLSPEPVGGTAIGWLAALQPDGRAACAPATHVLLRFAEGTTSNVVEAVIAPAAPQLALDLFVGDYVSLSGGVDVAPNACRFLTWKILYATRARSAEPPPP